MSKTMGKAWNAPRRTLKAKNERERMRIYQEI